MAYGMTTRLIWNSWLVFSAIALLPANEVNGRDAGEKSSRRVDFNRDIRPILSDNCFKCHGPDAHDRQADLRLDSQQGLLDAEDLISPRDSESSELLRRLITDDESELMPPPDSGRELSDEQKELLRRWIDEGAAWQDHWSFIPARQPDVPRVDFGTWPVNAIDHFTGTKMKQVGLWPNVQADRNVLIRRVSLDLTGLPPTPDLVSRYSSMQAYNWYEQLIEEVMQSEHYGEQMARYWLDAARYGDTHGLHLDNYREMWLYRDWVVDSFNQNLSYRDFVIEQLAGDLLKDPSESQLVATGFNRAHVSTNEGGSIKEEVLVRNVVDRVSTTSTVFLGLTVGCAQCHDHKYDPISQQEFYELYAFFNSLDANPMDGNAKAHAPVHRQFSDDEKERMSAMRLRDKALDEQIQNVVAEFSYEDPYSSDSEFKLASIAEKAEDHVWFDDSLPEFAKPSGSWTTETEQSITPFSGESSFVASSKDFTQMYFLESNPPLYFSGEDQFFVMVYLDPNDPPQEIMLQFNDGTWNHRAFWGKDLIGFGQPGTAQRRRIGDLPEAGEWVRLEVKAKEVGFKGRHSIQGIAFSQHGGRVFWDIAGVKTKMPQGYNTESLADWIAYQKIVGTGSLPKKLQNILKAKKIDNNGMSELQKHYIRYINPKSKNLLAQPLAEKEQIKKQLKSMTDRAPTTLIWREKAEPVPAYVLARGEYDQKGKQVFRGTPAMLPDFSAYRKDRLGLAHWLVNEKHPLTARVAVNRFWQQFFGNGIVETVEDFGAQGQLPSHPDLLDWLATDFVDNGWDVKRLVKQMLMSATYRQSSQNSSEPAIADPPNRWLSRGPRVRLDAEVLRDQALAVSGLLVEKIGGPGVKPPQPSGLWFAVGYSGSNTVRFKKDAGADKVHRRSIYTFWKRTSPPPQMTTFDAPSRESCVVRRERTNTPLQALLLMNDPQYVEAARHLAQLTIHAEGQLEQRVRWMFRRALVREPGFEELAILSDSLKEFLTEFKENPKRATGLVAIGESPASSDYDATELAAYTMLANLIMNMDEFVSRN